MYLVHVIQHYWRLVTVRQPQVEQPVEGDGPEAEYSRRVSRYLAQLSRCRTRHRLLWICFVVSAMLATAASASALWWHLSWNWLMVPAAALVCSFRALTRNARVHNKLAAIVQFYNSGLLRLRNQWQCEGISGEEYRPAKHLYASDLDLFGAGSLFEMLCTARTGIGRATLAEWLLHPATPDEIAARQQAIAELRDNLDLQERWAATGEDNPSRIDKATLREWAEASAVEFSPTVQVLALSVPVLTVAVCIMALAGVFGTHWMLPLAAVIASEAMLAASVFKNVQRVAESLHLPSFELNVLAPLLRSFQQERFRTSLLNRLQSTLARDDRSVQTIAQLRLYSRLLDLRRSEYLAAALSLLLWKTNLAILTERWRLRNRHQVMVWLQTIGQFEALLCLARYSFENPGHTFPQIDDAGSAFFLAEGMGHPLLPAGECISCNVSIDRDRRLMIVSGSNMSGKSTLLRAVGVNAVLAMAGAPVRAARLHMSALQLGCSITVRDSLLEGKSRFYAEVERLKEILELAKNTSVLILLDEVLAGTNSADRVFGTEAVLRRLLRSDALAIVTTHDLAIAALADSFGPEAANFHFEETYENGVMRFDYQLRPGALTRTNGVHVIAALGLLS